MMKKIIAFFLIISCILFVGCQNQQAIESRLEETAKTEVENNVLGEWMTYIRSFGIDDLEAEITLSDAYYDKEAKTYRTNLRLASFKSENSAERLAADRKELCSILEKTLEAYNSYGGKTYEWKTDKGETIKVDVHITNNTEINIDDSEGKSYGIRKNLPDGTIEYFENGQVVDPNADTSEKNSNKTDKNVSNKKNTSGSNSSGNTTSTNSNNTKNNKCSECGRKKKCSVCGVLEVYNCRGYRHYCKGCWDERNERSDDYWDDDYYDDDYYDDDDDWDDDDWDDDEFYYDGDYYDY